MLQTFLRLRFSKTCFWGLEAECFNPISKHSSCRSREMDTPAALVLRNRLRNRGRSSSTELLGYLCNPVHFCIFDMLCYSCAIFVLMVIIWWSQYPFLRLLQDELKDMYQEDLQDLEKAPRDLLEESRICSCSPQWISWGTEHCPLTIEPNKIIGQAPPTPIFDGWAPWISADDPEISRLSQSGCNEGKG